MMKQKLAILSAVLLLFSACQPAAPAEAPGQMPSGSFSQEAVSSGSASSSPTPEKGTVLPTSKAPLQDAPKPDSLPPSQGDALKLPDTLYTSLAGYSLEVLTPAQYDIEIPMNRGGYRGFIPCDVFKASRGDKFALFNPNGKQISDVIYENDDSWWDATNGVVFLRKDGKMGGVNAADGSIVVPFEYDRLWGLEDSGYFQGSKGNQTSILDQQGQVKYTLERGDEFYAGDGIDLLLQSGTLKLLRQSDGLPLKNLAGEEARVLSSPDREGTNEEFLIGLKVGSKWGILDGNGEFLADTLYDDLGYSYSGDYIEMTKNGKKGVLDYKGEVVVKPEWDDLLLSPTAASVCRERKWGAITDLDEGKVTVELFYDFVGRFDENGYAEAVRNEKYGIIDKEGNQVVMLQQGSRVYSGSGFEEGVFLIEGDDGPFSAGVMAGGKLVIPTNHFILEKGANLVYSDDEPYNLVSTPNGKFGYIDRQGQFVIDARFEEAEGFIKDRDIALVKLNGKICLIDRKGNTLLETVFDDCGGFNPETMVFAMRYTDEAGVSKSCLVKISGNENTL